MRYPNIHEGRFLRRPNRFIAHVEIRGREEVVHVKNTGRCRELLTPDAEVWLVKSDNPARKTKYDLVAVKKGERIINMDSQAPNQLMEEYIRASGRFGTSPVVRREYTHGDSRFDFFVEDNEKRYLIEVKGVTLEQDNVAKFPDAPTERGVKHLKGLIRAKQDGFIPCVCFVVQMDGIVLFRPNDDTHPQFGEMLREAQAIGVEILALGCNVKPGESEIAYTIPIDL